MRRCRILFRVWRALVLQRSHLSPDSSKNRLRFKFSWHCCSRAQVMLLSTLRDFVLAYKYTSSERRHGLASVHAACRSSALKTEAALYRQVRHFRLNDWIRVRSRYRVRWLCGVIAGQRENVRKRARPAASHWRYATSECMKWPRLLSNLFMAGLNLENEALPVSHACGTSQLQVYRHARPRAMATERPANACLGACLRILEPAR